MTGTLVTASDTAFVLAEGPLWDPVRERVLWVDVRSGRAFSGILEPDGTIVTADTLEVPGTLGAIGVSERGDWILAGQECIYYRSITGELFSGPRVLPEGTSSRLNDGKPDPNGRYLVGSLSLGAESKTEILVAINHDGSQQVIDCDLMLSNGLTWTRDGRTLYSIDTMRQTVFRRAYDRLTGGHGEREVFLTTENGFPDGLTIDEHEHLWIAMWGLGEVHRVSPTAAWFRHWPSPLLTFRALPSLAATWTLSS